MKAKRHRLILELIEYKSIETQEELAEELARQGMEVTQATVSRDIKELGLVKIPAGGDVYRYAAAPEPKVTVTRDRIRRFFRDAVVNIDHSENLIVIKTLPGSAQGVASTIDTSGWPEVLGTVAGDDTILVVIKPKEMVETTIAKFRDLTR
ncbi:MAG: arginine repressor [Clostridia bacterium]|nr:arginine repressor [Clostridia bacterium]